MTLSRIINHLPRQTTRIYWSLLMLLGTLLLLTTSAFASDSESRFPPPDFRSGYQIPATTLPAPRSETLRWVDVLLLTLALSLATWAVHKKRSRKVILALSVFSVLYFGFYRAGCVCPVGSTQNVILALTDYTYVLPWNVLAFFALPLLFALFVGRVFCSGVCPLGAIQDLVLWKPFQIRPWIETTLSLFAYIYLGLALVFAATNTQFLICSYDPFIGFFRFGGASHYLDVGSFIKPLPHAPEFVSKFISSMHTYTQGISLMILLGVLILILSMFIGRFYCRFICPYSVLLRWTSRLSQWRIHVAPPPATCIDCRLCERSCPFGALTTPNRTTPSLSPASARRRQLLGFLATLLLVSAGAWAGWTSRGYLSQTNDTVQLANYVKQGKALKLLKESGDTPEALYRRAATVQQRFGIGGSLVGGGFMLIVGLRFLFWGSPLLRPATKIYDTDPAGCLACARCFAHCPIDRSSQGQLTPTLITLKPEVTQ